MISLICPPDISPVRAWTLLGAMQRGIEVEMTDVERRCLWHYGYLDDRGRITREGGTFAVADDFEITAAQIRWRKAFGRAA